MLARPRAGRARRGAGTGTSRSISRLRSFCHSAAIRMLALPMLLLATTALLPLLPPSQTLSTKGSLCDTALDQVCAAVRGAGAACTSCQSSFSHQVMLRGAGCTAAVISKIENLEKLTKLKVLALFSNQIVEVEALETLQELEVLRLGNNKITNKKVKEIYLSGNQLFLFEVVIYLRQLPKLRTLSLKGNPVANIKDFDGYVAAFLPKVIFGQLCM